MDEMTLQTIRLNNGRCLPILGLGTFKCPAEAIRFGLACGYRHLDTAAYYGSEELVGQCIKECGLKRENIFVTSKVWNEDQGYEKTLRACETSLRKLQSDYLDAYLIHWPVTNLRLETWKALLKLYESGKCLSIGVSNFNIRHLEELLPTGAVVPAINQFEFSPFNYRKALVDYCHQKGITPIAYAPLARGYKIDHENIRLVANRHKKSAAQIILRWVVEHGMGFVFKSTREEHILENSKVFDFSLTAEDKNLLGCLNEDHYTVRPDFIPDKWL